MSIASASRTIKFVSKAGTYTAFLNSPRGDLFQYYKGRDIEHVTAVTPSWEGLSGDSIPRLEFAIISSRAAEGEVIPAQITWCAGGQVLAFNASGVSVGYVNEATNEVVPNAAVNGLFKRLTPSADHVARHTLLIMGNVAPLYGYTSVTIKAIGGVAWGTQMDTIAAQYTIQISRYTGDSYRAVIMEGGTRTGFVLRDVAGQDECELKGVLYDSAGIDISTGTVGVASAPRNFVWKWYKGDAGAWVELSAPHATPHLYRATRDEVNTTTIYRMEIWEDGQMLASDIQDVRDVSDPYDVEANPSPEDETIEEGSGQGVTYTPVVVRRGRSSEGMVMACRWWIKVMDAQGNLLNDEDIPNEGDPFNEDTWDIAGGYEQGAHIPVTYAMVEQAMGDVTVELTANPI